MKDLLLDIRYALRVLWKSPAFTLVALITLMLGIGANVLVFGVLNAVLLHPLDVSDPQNLYQLRLGPWTSGKLLTTSYPAFEDYRRRNTTFRELAGFYGFSQARLSWGNSAKSVSGYAVTGNYFDLLGVQPEVGRFIQTTDEHGPNSAPYVVLSDSLWRSAFNGDPGVIGTTVRINRDSFTVVGVAPAQFHGTERFDWPDYWIPIVNYFEQSYLEDRTGRPLVVLGRLRPGVTPQQAAENLSAIAVELAKEYPKTDTGVPLRLIRPGLGGDDGDVIRGSLYSVAGLALLVLAAACSNLASLFAARAADRSRELALRVALGAGRWRLVRQLMTEAMVLSMLGGAAGLLIAALLLRALNMAQSPYGHLAVSVDVGVYLAALILTLVSGLLFGMIPAKNVWQSSPLQAMKSGPVDSTPVRRLALRDLLLGAQIVICTLLVTASFVAVRGMVRMPHTPLGFQPQGAMLAEMDFSEVKGEVPLEKMKAMIEAVRSIPSVTVAGTVSKVPFTAIGQRFIILGHLREVVGVAENGKYHEMQESPQPVVYLPLPQSEQRHTTFVVRSRRAQTEMAAALERTLSSLEPNAPITVQSWPDAMGYVLFLARASTVALGVMGLLAVMLAVTGIFGMAAYNVSRRMKEVGIRVALGARTKHVMSAAVGRPIVLLGVGSLVGLLLGVFASRLLGQIVYQANPRDPVVVVGAVLTMALLGIVASAIPALRALAVDPSKLLREE